MNFFKIIRTYDWWEYKMSTLLAIGYATALVIKIPVEEIVRPISFVLVALFVGAVYVSILNDISDIQEDAASCKTNRMAKFNPAVRALFLLLCILAGLVIIYFLSDDPLSLVLYLLSWIAFCLYSSPPFRFKKRELAGVLCDAAGAHFFPTLFVASFITHYHQQPLPVIWFVTAGAWSLAYGVRGILWHQFQDRENDRKIGLHTFAASKDPLLFKSWGFIIALVECAALAVMLSLLHSPIVLAGLCSCLALVIARIRYFNTKIVTVIAPKEGSYHILLSDYYQFFFPVSVLLADASVNPVTYIVLGVHLLLFSKTTFFALRDLSGALSTFLGKLR